jgi:hypothetical protein
MSWIFEEHRCSTCNEVHRARPRTGPHLECDYCHKKGGDAEVPFAITYTFYEDHEQSHACSVDCLAHLMESAEMGSWSVSFGDSSTCDQPFGEEFAKRLSGAP